MTSKHNPTIHKYQLSRRQFMTQSAASCCGVAMLGLGLSLGSQQANSASEWTLRPPGALEGKHFLAACVRCGQCVRACPYDTLKLADLGDPIPTGVPYFESRITPCEMCEDIPCVKACPSGALSPALENIDDARMGLATLIDKETCLNMQGLRCDVCYRICPLMGTAITLETHRNQRTGMHAVFEPRVHSDICTGCGKCEHACVLEKPAIKILPRSVVKGELGEHYRFGWEEKHKNGGSLIPKMQDFPDRLPSPDGVQQ